MPLDERDYRVELTGTAPESSPAASSPTPSRPFLRVLFACCGVYQRVYKTADGRHYHGRCPRCGRSVRFAVGPGGTDQRFFVAR